MNCASASCAPLPPWAFDGDRLDEQLEESTRGFLSDPANVRVEGGALHLSSLLNWYGGDFTAEGWEPRAESVPQFVARYSTPEVTGFISEQGGAPKIRFIDYDWSLNSVER